MFIPLKMVLIGIDPYPFGIPRQWPVGNSSAFGGSGASRFTAPLGVAAGSTGAAGATGATGAAAAAGAGADRVCCNILAVGCGMDLGWRWMESYWCYFHLFSDSVLAINALNILNSGTESHGTQNSWSWIALLHSNGLIGGTDPSYDSAVGSNHDSRPYLQLENSPPTTGGNFRKLTFITHSEKISSGNPR